MTRYVCDNCGKTADTEMPSQWETVQVMKPNPGQSGIMKTVYFHLCEDHDAEDLIHGTPSSA